MGNSSFRHTPFNGVLQRIGNNREELSSSDSFFMRWFDRTSSKITANTAKMLQILDKNSVTFLTHRGELWCVWIKQLVLKLSIFQSILSVLVAWICLGIWGYFSCCNFPMLFCAFWKYPQKKIKICTTIHY